MEFDELNHLDFPRPMDELEFLDSLVYADEAWFAVQRPLFSDHRTRALPVRVTAESAMQAPVSPLRFAPIVPISQTEDIAPLQPRRSGSTSSVETSPETRKAKPFSRPISPKSERRRLRTYSSEDSDFKSDDRSEDSDSMSGFKARKKTKLAAPTVCHTSAFRGVSCCGKDRKFQARIRDGSKVHYLGRFDNEFDAAIKYDEAARSHKGDSAVPNFVEMNHAEMQMLRAHYFANNLQILPEFHHFLFQGTLERLEMKRNRKMAAENKN